MSNPKKFVIHARFSDVTVHETLIGTTDDLTNRIEQLTRNGYVDTAIEGQITIYPACSLKKITVLDQK
jgi:hypothetical protein